MNKTTKKKQSMQNKAGCDPVCTPAETAKINKAVDKAKKKAIQKIETLKKRIEKLHNQLTICKSAVDTFHRQGIVVKKCKVGEISAKPQSESKRQRLYSATSLSCIDEEADCSNDSGGDCADDEGNSSQYTEQGDSLSKFSHPLTTEEFSGSDQRKYTNNSIAFASVFNDVEDNFLIGSYLFFLSFSTCTFYLSDFP